ncbi:MAG: hypothetical protein AAF226_02995 [Verrucomicrobiota bacterium]
MRTIAPINNNNNTYRGLTLREICSGSEFLNKAYDKAAGAAKEIREGFALEREIFGASGGRCVRLDPQAALCMSWVVDARIKMLRAMGRPVDMGLIFFAHAMVEWMSVETAFLSPEQRLREFVFITRPVMEVVLLECFTRDVGGAECRR